MAGTPFAIDIPGMTGGTEAALALEFDHNVAEFVRLEEKSAQLKAESKMLSDQARKIEENKLRPLFIEKQQRELSVAGGSLKLVLGEAKQPQSIKAPHLCLTSTAYNMNAGFYVKHSRDRCLRCNVTQDHKVNLGDSYWLCVCGMTNHDEFKPLSATEALFHGKQYTHFAFSSLPQRESPPPVVKYERRKVKSTKGTKGKKKRF